MEMHSKTGGQIRETELIGSLVCPLSRLITYSTPTPSLTATALTPPPPGPGGGERSSGKTS